MDRPRLAALSAVVGPALMSVGDLFHPPESWDPAVQVAILADGASRWYAAHLLLFIGSMLFVPGVLGLTGLGADRRPRAAYAARVLMLISLGGMAAVFVFEMLLGTFISQGADQATAVLLLETFQAPAVSLAVLPAMSTFFVATGFLVWSLAPSTRVARWTTICFGLGAAAILAEILLAQVLLSQLGNILILVAGMGFARALLPSDREVA